MNWTNPPATERQTDHPERPGHQKDYPKDQGKPPSGRPPELRVGRKTVSCDKDGREFEAEVLTLSLGAETIPLLPLRNWGQLDVFKWQVRGKLPGTPAGLEVTFDHVRLAGETVALKDPQGPEKLEKLFNEWLELEKGNLELAGKKPERRPATAPVGAARPGEPAAPHFRVEVDKGRHVHISCLQGKEEMAMIGLNPQGFNGLFSQGIMRKPHSLKIGVLHDWVELDGTLFSFQNENNDAALLEKTLNERYLPETGTGRSKDVVVLANPASSTGFDIQFPVSRAGVQERRRRALNEEAIELLQDPAACGLLHQQIVLKLVRPNLIFKLKTHDGGEQYLPRSPANTLTIKNEDGAEKVIDLSQPVSYLRLSPIELTAIFNHPSINRHTQAAPAESHPDEPVNPPHPPKPDPPVPPSSLLPAPPYRRIDAVLDEVRQSLSQLAAAQAEVAMAAAPQPVPASHPGPKPVDAATPGPSEAVEPPPNLWLEAILARPSVRHDWFTCLVYSKLAETFGLSCEGKFGFSACWTIPLGEVQSCEDAAFKGFFLTDKRGLGYLNQGHLVRFGNGVASIGTAESAITGIGVDLVGVGLESKQRVAFIVTDGYRDKFSVPEKTVAQELARLEEHGALVLSVQEVLAWREPIEVVWTVPAQQEDPNHLQALQSVALTNAAGA